MNTAIIAGTIATEPELRYIQDGQTAIAETTLQIPGLRGEDPAERLKAIIWGQNGQDFIGRKFAVGTEIILEGRLSMKLVEREGGYKEKVAELSVNRYYPVTFITAGPPPVDTATSPIPPAPEPAKATAKASKGKAEAAKAPVAEKTEEYEANYNDIPF